MPQGGAKGSAGPASSSGGGVAGAEDLVEREAKRLEVMKRRQERELAQLISFEMARKEMQDKAEAKVGGGGVGWLAAVWWGEVCTRGWEGGWLPAWLPGNSVHFQCGG